MSTEQKWWLDVLKRGCLGVSHDGIKINNEGEYDGLDWEPEVSNTLLYACYLDFADKTNANRRLTYNMFGKFMQGMAQQGRLVTIKIGEEKKREPRGKCWAR